MVTLAPSAMKQMRAPRHARASISIRFVSASIQGVAGARKCAVRAEKGGDGARPTILVAEKLGQAGLDMLAQYGNVDCSYEMSPADLCAKISLCDALIVRSGTKVTKEVFEAAKGRLKVVGRAGVGIDNVDLTSATQNGVMVVNAPNANTIAAAEHGIALMCALSRNVAQADASMKKGEWKRSKYVGVSLTGKTLAVFGFGKVGSDVARRAKGLGMNVVAHDPYASEEKARALNVRLVTFSEAVATADFLSLHMPLTPGTKDMFNAEVLAKCKPSASIINVARGGVINEADLLAAVENGQIAGAALDVFSEEPPSPDMPLLKHPAVICTPHLGASTKEAQEGVAIEVAEAVVTALRGELSGNTVNAPMVAAEVLAELQPYITLSQGLGKTAVQLVAEQGFSALEITYISSRGDDLDTRLLRANVVKGVLEEITTANVNMVNADLLAQQRGLAITETIVRAEGADAAGGGASPLAAMAVSIGAADCKFTGALDGAGRITVQGRVTNGVPTLTRVGVFEVDVALEGFVLLVRQQDRPGLVAAVAQRLAQDSINVSFMTVGRITKGQDAIMAIGVDSRPGEEVLKDIPAIDGIMECGLFQDL